MLKKPGYVACTETTVVVHVECEAGLFLEYKEFPQEWTEALAVAVDKSEMKLTDLNPGSTYNFRLTNEDGHGPDLVVDTQAPGCTPKPRRCCSLM